MASHGAELYRQAISANVELAHKIAKEINNRSYLKLVRDPQLSVVVFERLGWEQFDYESWSEKLLTDQFAFVVPSSHQGKPNTRFAIVNPLTKYEDLVTILDSME
jgi:glutamate/tyrosine decarboxylase-like PLP-dependent enzyme